MAECFFLFLECALKVGHRLTQTAQTINRGNLKRRRISVVGRLMPVDVIKGMHQGIFAPRSPQQLDRPVGHYFVNVHVRRSPGAPLEHVEPELVVELSGDDLLAGLLDARQDLLAELATLDVRPCRGQLHHGEALDQVGVQAQLDARDVEVLEGAGRLDPVVGLRGDGLLT